MFVGGSIPVIIGLSTYRSLGLLKRLILVLMICSLGLNIVQIILALFSVPNLFIAHIYTLLEFLFIVFIYKIKLNDIIPSSNFLKGVIFFVMFSFLNTFFIQGWQTNNSYQRILESVLVIALILVYFFKTLKELKVKRIDREPLFWFSGGALLYFSGALFIFIFSNYLLKYSQSLGIIFWAIHAFFLIIFYIGAAIALWINPKK
ncbi:hypothetical protein BKI52_30830 [marine bacterium AO1-C]|nr:hypothetical protein BKI52_30830 [marine bacterium AO1-C]